MDDIQDYIEKLSGDSRCDRQESATTLLEVAKSQPEALIQYIDTFCEALNFPEGQTRFTCLAILCTLVAVDEASCGKAVKGAELALFDEDNPMVRLWGFRFLVTWGMAAPENSSRVWPLIDDAVQCYHGDIEYADMLSALVKFSGGSIAPEVKSALAKRMEFDASTPHSTLQRKSQMIIDNCK